jgi:hypothetical protein
MQGRRGGRHAGIGHQIFRWSVRLTRASRRRTLVVVVGRDRGAQVRQAQGPRAAAFTASRCEHRKPVHGTRSVGDGAAAALVVILIVAGGFVQCRAVPVHNVAVLPVGAVAR